MPAITAAALGALALLISILAIDARKPLGWLDDRMEAPQDDQGPVVDGRVSNEQTQGVGRL